MKNIINGFDIIGDIHGHAEALEFLLAKMGYKNKNGCWQHPDRMAMFLGDFIDRGPENLRSADIVRRMVENGHARAVMANHEINALFYRTENPLKPGEMIRDNSNPEYQKQHEAFLVEEAENPEFAAEIIEFFRTLPLYLDMGFFKMVHACWSQEDINVVEQTWQGNADEAFIKEAGCHYTRLYDAVEVILKGIEVPLPGGIAFRDQDGNRRRNARVKWWREEAAARETLLALGDAGPNITDTQIDVFGREIPTIDYGTNVPVFFGHYWMRGNPKIINEKRACLDWSVVRNDGHLCAYRWDGEENLSQDKMVWINRSDLVNSAQEIA